MSEAQDHPEYGHLLESMSEGVDENGDPIEPDEPDEDEDGDEVLNLAMFPDDPPKSGEWVDVDDAIADAAEEEYERGRQLGETIDPDDDDDTGMDDEGTESDG